MMRALLVVAVAVGAISAATSAFACSPLIATDPVTGDTWTSGSPEWLRREQADWRARSDGVLLVQVRAGRMISSGEIEFTLAPIEPVYAGDLPDADLLYRWHPGNTCNTFQIAVADILVAYAAPDGAVIGVIPPERLQDRPPTFGRRLREIERGLIRPRTDPDPD